MQEGQVLQLEASSDWKAEGALPLLARPVLGLEESGPRKVN